MPHFYPSGVSDELIELCNHDYTIASTLAKNPSTSVASIWQSLYPKPFVFKRLVNRFLIKHDLYHGRGDPTKEDLDRAEKCGKFPYRPSDLFLKIFSDVLLCLERDPLSDMCAPPLIGTSGVIPLSIISVIPDIMQHYYDCIVRAEKEVVLATNYWQPSNSVNKISSALIELSKIVSARKQADKIVVKIMWDRGTFSQLYDNHASVPQEAREALDLPTPDEIPNIDLEVINFHRPLLGTFHVKFLIVDRKIALLNSNNIQDRPNLEMMIHLEGAVVESFYDIFLFSWHHKLSPTLPFLTEPPKDKRDHTAKASDFHFQEQNPYLNDIELVKAARAARAMLHLEKDDDDKLARLRDDVDKEQRLFGGYGRGFQAVLGAITESRRGSFSADARDQELMRDATGEGNAHKKEHGHIRFADAVFKAMDARRKGNLSPGPNSAGESSQSAPHSTQTSTHTSPVTTKNPEMPLPNGNAHPEPNSSLLATPGASTADQPNLMNWEQPTSTLKKLQQEIHNLGSPARAKENAEAAQAHAQSEASTSAAARESKSRSTSGDADPGAKSHLLPTLDLPDTSFSNDFGGLDSEARDAHGTVEMNSHTLQPPTTGDHSLSPVASERSSVGHPGASSESLLATSGHAHSGRALATSQEDGQDRRANGELKSKDYAEDDIAETPALAHSQYSAATEPSSKGPATPPVNAADNSMVPAVEPSSSRFGSDSEHASASAHVSKPHQSLFSHIMDRDGKPLGPFKFSALAERRNANISTGSKSAGSKPPPKKNWIEGLVLGKGAKAGPAVAEPEIITPRQRALSNALNAGALSQAWSTVEDSELLDEFNPHTLHHAHDPFPIAMVNRKPHGLPGHQDIRVPQDAAWLAGIRYAQKSVFIQTPTFNAKPIVRACVDACRRGIQVTIWVDLGFNDKGESMPFQGGTNEQVVERMYSDLKATNHQMNLHVYWYTGKDQVRPLNAVKKQRNCHVKFMQVDDQVAIQGNGNQDTQSWYHSSEVNVLIDSAQIVRDWMEALRRQQNTELYGRVDADGIWRDKATGRTPAEMDTVEAAELAALQTPQESNGQAAADQNGGNPPQRSSSRLSLRKKAAKSAFPPPSVTSPPQSSVATQ